MSDAPTRKRYQQAARELLRDSLLDAAGELLREYTWSDINMAAIATQAGVSRQTLYNEFGTRDEFAQAYALREAARFLETVQAAIAAHPDDHRKALYNGFTVFMREAAGNPMVRQIVVRDPGADDLLALFTTRGGPVVEFAKYNLSEQMIELWPQADPESARLVAESLVRLAISHVGLPTGSIEDAARGVGELLGPYLDQELNAAPAPAA
ncbi:MAG: TetR family transcriptional regulator [Solirubrobacterales bacterium]